MLRETLVEFQRWVREPFELNVTNVVQTMKMLTSHPLAHDTTIGGHFEFRKSTIPDINGTEIHSEEQGVWAFYVLDRDENKLDPPVNFRSTIDLSPFGGPTAGTPVVACEKFSEFIWQSLAQTLCLRETRGDSLNPAVQGISFDSQISLDDSFHTFPLLTLPNNVCCFYNEKVICDPQNGYASFLNEECQSQFLDQYQPNITMTWS